MPVVFKKKGGYYDEELYQYSSKGTYRRVRRGITPTLTVCSSAFASSLCASACSC